MKNKTTKLAILLVVGLVFPLILTFNFNFSSEYQPKLIEPKESGGYNEPFIHINGANWSSTASSNPWCYFDNGYYIIENVTIDASSSPTGSGIYIENSTNDYFIIRNCTIFNADSSFFDSGIWLENTSNGTLTNNNCSGNRQGIYLSNCEANNLTENIVSNNEINGIYLETNCDHNSITGNTADNNLFGIQITTGCDYNNITLNTANENDDYGIYINSFGTSCDNNVILNNTANENNRHGIYLRYSNNENSIINNSVNDNIETGIYVVNSHMFNVTCNTIYNNKRGLDVFLSDNSDIRGNTIVGNDVGINFRDCDSNEIKNNTIDNNDLGIRLDTSDYNNITGNILKDNNWCIYETYSEGNIIESNDCSSPTTDLPIYIDDYATGMDAHNWTWAKSQPWCSGTGTSVDPYILENLKISGFGIESYGIDIRNSNVSFIIQECLIYNADDAGIYLDNVNNSRIINNNCSNNENGIYIEYSNSIIISENDANDNRFDGISIFESNDVDITGNNINNNGDSGLKIDECNFNTISGNIIDGNQDGIFFYRTLNNTIIGNTVRNNSGRGIHIDEDSDYNEFTENIIRNNTIGFNIASFNENNLVYKNLFLNNGLHAFDDGTANKWNSTTIGNYWDNHTGPDDNKDGIVDIPYVHIGGTAGSIDYLPMVEIPSPGGSDPGVIVVIVIVSIIGGVSLVVAIFIILLKKEKIPLDKIKSFSFRKK